MNTRAEGWFLLVALHLLVGAGCEIALVPTGVDVSGGNGTSPSDPRGAEPGGDPGDSFADATALTLDGEGKVSVSALLGSTHDVDLYTVGPLLAGDRITVEVIAQTSPLDPLAALFDDQMRLVGLNDDRDFDRNQFDPLLDVVTRHDGNPSYIGVAAFSGSGAYVLSVQVFSGERAPAPVPQAVLLDFDGGSIVLLDGLEKTVPPLDAADIDLSLAGSTDALKDVIVATVASNFAGLDIAVLNTDDAPPPMEGTFSRVLLGGFSADVFGEAQGVDAYNGDPVDEAIVYTEGFSRTVFGGRHRPPRFGRSRVFVAERPCGLVQRRLRSLLRAGISSGSIGVEEVGLAIGNVAAHEVGHLLGLNHVADPRFLMDTIGTADTLLNDQVFGLAPLDDSIFPVGFQDSALLLRETVGPTSN